MTKVQISSQTNCLFTLFNNSNTKDDDSQVAPYSVIGDNALHKYDLS